MRHRLPAIRCLLGISLLLVACASSTGSNGTVAVLTDGTAVDGQSQMRSLGLTGGADTGNTPVEETLHVVVAGGPRSGTYDKTATTGGCSYGLAGADSFGNQYTDSNEKTGLSSLQVVVPSTKEAATRTSRFNADFTFGDIESDSRTIYQVEGRGDAPVKGSGMITIANQGKTAQVVLHAEVADGVVIDAMIDCKAVLYVK